MCVTFVQENTSIYAHPGKFVGVLVELEMESGTQMAQKKCLRTKEGKKEQTMPQLKKGKIKGSRALNL